MTDDEGNPNAPGRPDAAPRDGDESPETGTGTDAASSGADDGSDRTGSKGAERPEGVADEGGTRTPDSDAHNVSDAYSDSDARPGSDRRRDSDRRPRPQPGTRAADRDVSFLTRFRTAQSGPLLFIRETLYSALAVAAVGLLLFAISGVWPPMVAVESGSMEPEMSRGDLIFVTEPQRFTPDYAYGDTGVVTVEIGSEEGYRSFGGNGSVVIYDPPSRAGSPIIHRAHFYVEEGENWYDRANPAYMNANDCSQLSNCPAPHDGFITKGDANARYDQASNIAGPVRTEWIRGTARIRIPYLGYVRLKLAGALAA